MSQLRDRSSSPTIRTSRLGTRGPADRPHLPARRRRGEHRRHPHRAMGAKYRHPVLHDDFSNAGIVLRLAAGSSGRGGCPGQRHRRGDFDLSHI